MNIEDFVDRLEGVKGGPVQFTSRCPAHEDSHSSLSVGLGKDGRILVHCHAGCDLGAILERMGLMTGDLFAGITLESSSRIEKIPLQRTRGEVNLQICKYPDFSDENPDGKEAVYRYQTAEGAPLFEVVRAFGNEKSFRQRRKTASGRYVYNLRGVEPVLYRLPEVLAATEAGGEVWLCEGEKDAERLVSLGFNATTAPMGAGKWRESYTEALAGVGRLLILPDNDKPGRAHAALVAKSFAKNATDEITVSVVDLKAMWPGLPTKGDVSDLLEALGDEASARFNDFLVKPADFEALRAVRDAEDAAAADLKKETPGLENAAAYLTGEFEAEVVRYRQNSGLSTGFSGLDSQLSGGLYPGLYVVGSVSSLGKTAFCLQMADHIAAAGRDVLFFTLEMSRMEMVARSLSRMLFEGTGFDLKAPVSVADILAGEAGAALPEVLARYREGTGRHIHFVEGEGGFTPSAVERAALAHREQTGAAPVVFVDYLQILRPGGPGLSDKQAMDRAVLTFKGLSRALEAPVVAVSSFNRQSYGEEVSMAAFKESGTIEYSADFVLALQAAGISGHREADERRMAKHVHQETKAAKQKTPRPLEAVTLKNRRGAAWDCFGLDFYPAQNCFAETGR